MLDDLKAWLGNDAGMYTDAQLDLSIRGAERFILNYCRRDDFPEALDMARLQIAVIACNRSGSEGAQSQAEGSVSVSFMPAEADIPASILSQLNTFRKVGIPGADAAT
jgi:hypothetical protein